MTRVKVGGGARTSARGTLRPQGTLVGSFDPANGLPTIGSGLRGRILKGDYWKSSGVATIAGVQPFEDFEEEDLLYASKNDAVLVADFFSNKAQGGGSTVSVDGTTIQGDGSAGSPLNVPSGVFDASGAAAAAEVAAKSYADGLVVGLWDDRGNFNASVNAYPSSGGSGTAGAILKGDIWTISVAGTLPTGQAVGVGDTVRALIDTPGNTQTNWAIAENNIGYVPENAANKDATGGYVGLTLFKINFKNALNTITSFFTNFNTVARTYTFQNRDGTIADDTDLALKVPTTRTVNGQALSGNIVIPLNDSTYYTQSGKYITGAVQGYSVSTNALAANTLRAYPIVISKTLTITEIVTNISTNVGATVFRVGLYTDNGSCYPNQLVSGSDAAEYDSSTMGNKSSGVISVVLTPGLYWVAINSNGAPTTRAISSVAIQSIIPHDANGASTDGYTRYAVTQAYGVMPSTFPAGASTSVSAANRVEFKV